MEKVACRIYKLAESATLAMSKKARELEDKGLKVIKLNIGEPDFDTPEYIKNGAIAAINVNGEKNFTTYPPVDGYKSLRETICKKLKNENHLDFKPEQIVVSTGAKHSIMNVMLSLIDPSDEVIVPAPYWVSYSEMIRFAEGTVVEIKTTVDNNFKFTPQQLENAITTKTKAIIFSSPSNPTGSLYTKSELETIANVLAKYPEIIIIADEIYEHINFTGNPHESIAQFENIRDRVIIINGVSKGYAMTGWRIGYIAAPKWIADAVSKLQGQFTSGACSIAQKAAETALANEEKAKEEIIKMRESFKRRRDIVFNLLKEIPNIKIMKNPPEGAFYYFIDISAYLGKSFNGKRINTSDDLAMFLLQEALVATVGGVAFGAPECLRISYATSDDKLKEALANIKNVLKKLE